MSVLEEFLEQPAAAHLSAVAQFVPRSSPIFSRLLIRWLYRTLHRKEPWATYGNSDHVSPKPESLKSHLLACSTSRIGIQPWNTGVTEKRQSTHLRSSKTTWCAN